MFRRTPGAGSLYWLTTRDVTGTYLDGGRSYTLTVPQPVPAQLFWSITVYDARTRSEIATDQNKAALRSMFELADIDTSGPVACTSGRPRPRMMLSATGSRPSQKQVGSSTSASTDRPNPPSTAAGNSRTSSPPDPHRSDHTEQIERTEQYVEVEPTSADRRLGNLAVLTISGRTGAHNIPQTCPRRMPAIRPGSPDEGLLFGQLASDRLFGIASTVGPWQSGTYAGRDSRITGTSRPGLSRRKPISIVMVLTCGTLGMPRGASADEISEHCVS